MNVKAKTLEYVNCKLCGADDYRVLYLSTVDEGTLSDPALFRQSDANSQSCQIVKCNRCGLTYTNPREPLGLINEIYASVEDEEYPEQRDWKLAAFRWNLARLEEHIDNERLLDVGCGHGFFLSLLGPGWKGIGLEPAAAAVEYATGELGLDVRRGFLNREGFKRESFDAITMFHVLEHAYSPCLDLDICYDLLKPGGYIYIEVPDFGAAVSRWRGRRWWYIMRFHTYYFDRHTLLRMLAKAGFAPVDVHFPKKYWHLGYIARKVAAVLPVAAPISKAIDGLRIGRAMIPVRPRDIIGVVAQKV
ncbi:MAG: class I SAM-dependent methyltransferase [bacterium]|nr:class I SAM-dependent methyltransferase [bacterium]